MAGPDLPHTMTVERLTASGTIKEAYVARPGTIKCWLQPALAIDTASGMGGQMTKGSRCFVDYSANVKNKDRITIDGVRYNVSGMTEHQYGDWPHKVLSVEAVN